MARWERFKSLMRGDKQPNRELVYVAWGMIAYGVLALPVGVYGIVRALTG